MNLVPVLPYITLGENLPKQLIIPRKAWSSFLFFRAGISIRVLIFCRSGFTPCCDIISPKNGTDVHLK